LAATRVVLTSTTPTESNQTRPPQIKDETARVEEEHKEFVAGVKKAKQDHKAWESNRESRVTNWRDYVKGSKGKPKAPTQLKPPKLKTNDEDKLFVSRPTTEQFRPAPAARPPQGGK
jgi:DnaJ family protein C protein 8